VVLGHYQYRFAIVKKKQIVVRN